MRLSTMLENWPRLAMDKQGNHKQSLPESLADPELEAILEAERLALEQLLEAADRDLREALEADRLSFVANNKVTAT